MSKSRKKRKQTPPMKKRAYAEEARAKTPSKPQDEAPPKANDPALLALLVLSTALLTTRWYAAKTLGFGDSEALYACYAAHPAPAYVDHPGLVGQLARGIAGDDPVTPFGIHTVTAVLATALPWLLTIAARRLGASARAALVTAIVFAVVPEIAVGLFALTPDLPLAFAWLAALGFAGSALSSKPKSARAASFFLGAGVMAGVAISAKATGALLAASLPLAYLTAPDEAKKHARTAWPWLGMALSALVAWPIISFEANNHWPMLRHRFVDTQAGAGFSLRNLAATAGGQLVYLSPVVFALVVVIAIDLFKRRRDDAVTALLFWTFFLPTSALLGFCLWSRVAEPHWLAPPMLALAIHAARRASATPSPWPLPLVRWAAGTAGALTLLVHVWVLAPSLASLWPKSLDAKADIASELYGWPDVLKTVDETLRAEEAGDGERGKDVWVVGPHWVICAQLHAAMPTAKVGCAERGTDFDDWAPRATWEKADAIVYVSDARFDGPEYDEEALFPAFARGASERVTVMRGGRISRTFKVIVLERRAAG